MVIIDSTPRIAEVRVGARTARAPGPFGASPFTTTTITRNGEEVELHFQTGMEKLIEHARILVPGDIVIPCHRATWWQLNVLDATFALVPPEHLRLVNERKPQGFLISDTTGRGSSLSYMGGLNARFDYPSTPDYDERQLILITHGALWENRDLGICPTVLHEIGHVMTHRGELSYGPFPEARAQELRGTRVSRNPGAMEALCNAYMYFLCYAATDPAVRNYGTRQSDIQRDRVTRAALRGCTAFVPPLLDAAWQTKFAER